LDLEEIGSDDADWINLSQGRIQWRTLENTVLNLRVSLRGVIYWVDERLLSPQEGLWSRLGFSSLKGWTATAQFPVGTLLFAPMLRRSLRDLPSLVYVVHRGSFLGIKTVGQFISLYCQN
jgi:hypothetical protein